MKNKEEILKRYGDKIREAIYQQELKPVYRPVFTNEIQNILYEALTKTREETIREEIAYWIDVFDNRPNNRDLESDKIAQNFARIEIERLENKLKK